MLECCGHLVWRCWLMLEWLDWCRIPFNTLFWQCCLLWDPFEQLVVQYWSLLTGENAILSPFTQPRTTWLIWLKNENWESQCLKYSIFYQPFLCIPLTFIFIRFVAAKETDKQSQLRRRCTSPDISNMLQSIQLSQQQPTVSSVLADMRYALLSEFLCRNVKK